MSQRSKYWREKEVPLTVPQCVCKSGGHFRNECSYAVEEEILSNQEWLAEQKQLKRLGVDTNSYGFNSMVK